MIQISRSIFLSVQQTDYQSTKLERILIQIVFGDVDPG